MATTRTDADIRHEVDQSLQGAPGYPDDYDIDGIVAEIVQLDNEPEHDEYWELVLRHAS